MDHRERTDPLTQGISFSGYFPHAAGELCITFFRGFMVPGLQRSTNLLGRPTTVSALSNDRTRASRFRVPGGITPLNATSFALGGAGG